MELLDGSNDYGLAISAGANDAKGSWVSLGTASADFSGIRLEMKGQSTNNAAFLFDLRVGGSDTVFENLLMGNKTGSAFEPSSIVIPFSGASSDAIELRGQTDNTSSRTVTFAAQLLTDVPWTPTTTTGSYGADTANTAGVSIDPGAVADTEGTKVELTTSGGLDHDTDYLVLAIRNPSTAIAVAKWRLRLYTGASGGTSTGVETIVCAGSTTDHFADAWIPLWVDRTVFASGTRVWISAQSDETDATDRLVEATLHSFQATGGGGGGSTVIVVED